MSRIAVLALVALLLPALFASPCLAWSAGRATFYGTDAWSIHTGSCGFGQLSYKVSTGWDVAAMADTASDYGGSCGKCKEVKCAASNFADGYGQWLDRQSVCYNKGASVVVQVVDTCQCHYPGNFFSNKRWCCGDMYHLDLSLWAYEKLASQKWGVIALQWRDVSCNYRPRANARVPRSFRKSTPMPAKYKPQPGWKDCMDNKRPGPRNVRKC